MPRTEREISNYELSPLAEVLSRQFVQRWDMYPQQQRNGRYHTVHEQLHVGLLFSHLRGDITLGTYLLNATSQGRFMVLDADQEIQWQHLQELAHVLDDVGCPSYLEQSRRGGHAWFFFEKWTAGETIRQFGKALMAQFSLTGIELYPKQAALDTGPGSLIRLPLGIHQRSLQRYGFITHAGEPLEASYREQLRELGRAQKVQKRFVTKIISDAQKMGTINRKTPTSKPHRPITETNSKLLSDQIKAAISIRDFVSRYVHLSLSGQGLCPFHDDEHPSFSVNAEGNYWHCFAGCGGGSIIDFWMLNQQCDFKSAVKDLANMLL